jgi:hypothetical protein
MTIGIFKEWLVKYFFVHKIVFKAIYDLVDGQNHEILKPAISGFYIRFHPVYRPCFYLPRKQMTPFY